MSGTNQPGKSTDRNGSVVYLNRGTAYYIRLVCSIFSLRRHYEGRVRVVQEGEPEAALVSVLDELGVEISEVPVSTEFSLVVKASIGRQLIDNVSVYLDSDTIVRHPIDELFEQVREHRLVATWFGRWRTGDGLIATRIRGWADCVPDLIDDALNYGKAINSGVYAVARDHEFLSAYADLTRRGYETGVPKIALDEVAFQILLPRFPHKLMDESWNVSGWFGPIENAKIVHYHGGRHCDPDNPNRWLWQQTYEELLAEFPAHREFLTQAWEDEGLGAYLDEKSGGELASS